MGSDFVIQLGQEALWVALKISGPILVFGLVVGLVVSIFQATTQIQEQSLSFIPKILAVVVALAVFGPWMLSVILDFTNGIMGNLMQFVR
ncbi:flagellar biosynthesis protein FliQ [Effusibacillus lacus]|uniref:Flagellar biosynthetic protein FliQ n=1 Tax=Effusibacillus lacus TaxID=1348429 RepID=A0A292YKR6_9BACL|nr:flagellar biosynthesis protein FliQ [Effusibacillus lacus]TCS73133.1 flagellar biosynthetic protein FliQ [Effusibacillus lacus]GAX90538.1 flagellar export apparatus protein FliQ [Effusibacillus lacus]